MFIFLSTTSHAEPKRDIRVDAGEAEEMLMEFAIQTDLSIVFDPEQLDGILTNRVVGTMLPELALQRMLEGTDLVFYQDKETGAFAVTRPEQPVAEHTTHSSEPKPIKETEMTVTKNNFIRTLATVLTLGVAGGGLNAQDRQQEDAQVFDLPEYSVYARAAESAVEAQRESDIIGSYLGSDALSDLPDDDLGEALTRLAGVNVVGGGGTDAAYVTVRGAEGQYNTIRINGASPANAKIGDRGFDLRQIPTEMVRSVEVIKSITAEYPGDSIGGTVNVTTATAFSLLEPLQRYKVEGRFRDANDESGWGVNYRYSNIYDLGSGKDNFGVFLNVNYTDESLVQWNTQNRFLDQASRLDDDDPNFESFANQTILSVNEDAHLPIWDRFDPDERRVSQDELTINASFDFKLSDKTTLYVRPWIQVSNWERDLYSFRIDRIERAFGRGQWFFLDENGSPLGQWVDDDGDGALGSEGDIFVNAVDANGELIMTQSYEANGDGRTRRQLQNRNNDNVTWTLDVGGETYFENATLDYRVFYSVDDEESMQEEWRFERDLRRTDGGLAPLRFRILDGTTPTPDFIVFEVTEGRGHVPLNNYQNVFGDLDNMLTNNNLLELQDVHEDRLLADINYEHQVDENFKFKTGLRYLKATRENFTNQLFMNPSAGGQRVLPASEMITDLETQTGGPMSIFGGQYKDTVGPYLLTQPFFDYFHSDLATNPENWVFSRSDLRDAADTADLEEAISAAFIQGTYRWKDLTIVAGVRYEKTELDTTWKPSNFMVGTENLPGLSDDEKANIDALIVNWLEDNNFPGDAATFSFGDWVDDINRKSDYDNVLPSAVTTWRVGDSGHVFRLAWTNTLTRPNPQQLIPFDLGLANKQLSDAGVPPVAGRTDDFRFGNPDLTEQTAENWDLAWEYYFGPDQRNALSVTFFKKKLEDFLVEASFDREVEVLVDWNDPSQGTEWVTEEAEFWTNGSTANIEGIEVSGYFNLGNIFQNSEFMQRISFVPNYTFIQGDSMLPSFDQDELNEGNLVQTGEQLIDGLIGQAEHIFNLQLFYETPRWNFRVSWNYVDEVLRNSSTAALDSLERDEASSRINLSIQYRLAKNSDTRLYLEVDNLTNDPQDNRYVGKSSGLYTQNYDEIGRRFVFGIRGSM
jgi:TonB-dependent receptor